MKVPYDHLLSWLSLGATLGAFGCYTSEENALRASESVVPKGDANNTSSLDLQGLRQRAQQILAEKCESCHGNGNQQGGFGYVTDLERMRSNNSRFVVPGKPEDSKVFQRITATSRLAMPPNGRLDEMSIQVIKQWILAEGQNSSGKREPMPMVEAFRLMREDFDRQQDRLNVRYVHFIDLWNANLSDETIQIQREALSKSLNLVSTRQTIVVPVAIDANKTIFRINLADYGLHEPHGFSSPSKPLERIGRWKEVFEFRRPARDNAVQDAYFAANYVVRPPEYMKASEAPCTANDPRVYQCDPNLAWMQSVMTLPNPVEGDNDPVLNDYLSFKGKSIADRQVPLTLRDVDDEVILPDVNGTAPWAIRFGKVNSVTHVKSFVTKSIKEYPVRKQNPTRPHSASNPIAFSHEHSPVPVLRGTWFVNQVASNYKARVYYHLAGIPDNSDLLDMVLGSDGEGGLFRDNDKDPQGTNYRKPNGEPYVIRAGFTNSGVSQDHRVLERVEAQQFADRALWRSYEFDPPDNTSTGRYNDILNYPFGPVFFPNDPGALGYECITMFSNPNMLFKVPRTGKTMADWASRYWTLTPIDLTQFRPTRIESRAAFDQLSPGDKDTYESYWGAQSTPGGMANVPTQPAGLSSDRVSNCEGKDEKTGEDIREKRKLFNFHGFEYQFMRPNGMQGFATVGANAFMSDMKIPNRQARDNPNAVFEIDPDNSNAPVVIQPLSCLSCHTRGLIPKQDAVRDFVLANAGPNKRFNQDELDKALRLYVSKDEFRTRLEKDNDIITNAIEKTGARIGDQEPIVVTYRQYHQKVTVEVVAATTGVSTPDLLAILTPQEKATADEARVLFELTPLRSGDGKVDRSVLEDSLATLVAMAVAQKKFR